MQVTHADVCDYVAGRLDGGELLRVEAAVKGSFALRRDVKRIQDINVSVHRRLARQQEDYSRHC